MKRTEKRPDPSPEEIAAMCVEIRKEWPEHRLAEAHREPHVEVTRAKFNVMLSGVRALQNFD